jgi:hypothetical protein
MPIRVAQVGTGNVGGHALRALIANPDYELTAVWVSSAAKAGKDAAELAGLDTPTGIRSTNDLDEVLATNPDCAVYNAMADNRIVEALEDYRRILAAGVNVVGSGPVFLQWPWKVIPDEMISPLENAAREGNSSLYVNGIDPGFANDQHRKLKTLTADITGQPLPILYGGSVNPQNCCSLAAMSDIDGLFNGRSAWEPQGFIGIIDAVTTSLGETS